MEEKTEEKKNFSENDCQWTSCSILEKWNHERLYRPQKNKQDLLHTHRKINPLTVSLGHCRIPHSQTTLKLCLRVYQKTALTCVSKAPLGSFVRGTDAGLFKENLTIFCSFKTSTNQMNSIEERCVRYRIIFQLHLYIGQQICIINLLQLCPPFPS